MKSKILAFMFILTFSILFASADSGCCINPNVASVCAAVTDSKDCCPLDIVTEAYGDNFGPENQTECKADWFFNTTLEDPCSIMGEYPNAHYCEEGCCCEALVDDTVDFNQEKQIICNDVNQQWFSLEDIGGECNQSNCEIALDLVKEVGDTCEQGVNSCGTDLACKVVVVVTGETYTFAPRSICCNLEDCAGSIITGQVPADQCVANDTSPYSIDLMCENGIWTPDTFLQKPEICAQVTGYNGDGTGILNYLGECNASLVCGPVLNDNANLICCGENECGFFEDPTYSCSLNGTVKEVSSLQELGTSITYVCDMGQWIVPADIVPGNDTINDTDGDGIFDDVDNCINDSNENQSDIDEDGIGDVCDDDIDGDTILNDVDNCPKINNTDQANNDNDTMGDVCDPDDDNDEVLDEDDNCPFIENFEQKNNDNDGLGDLCDPDDDNDDVPDDGDNSTVEGDKYCQIKPAQMRKWNKEHDNAPLDIRQTPDWPCDDNCKWEANPDQKDVDLDNIGDACDPKNDRLDTAWGTAFTILAIAIVIGLIIGLLPLFTAAAFTLVGLATAIAVATMIGLAIATVIAPLVYQLWSYFV